MPSNHTPDYPRCYEILGLAADESDWRRVRAAYRRLISNWHPDRVAETDLPIAEERTKAINTAYEVLADYYRAHGHLPRGPQPHISHGERSDPQAATAEGAQTAGPSGSTATRRKHQRHPLLRPAPWALGAIILGYVVLHVLSSDAFRVSSAPATSVPDAQRNGTAPPAERFTVGATLGDVASIQGAPTLADSNVWHYGKSHVRFESGQVVSWEEHPDNPLRAYHPRDQAPLEIEFFGLGSTRSTVHAIQGPPTRTEANTWYYGDSKVHFTGNRVSSWEEGHLIPLRVRR